MLRVMTVKAVDKGWINVDMPGIVKEMCGFFFLCSRRHATCYEPAMRYRYEENDEEKNNRTDRNNNTEEEA